MGADDAGASPENGPPPGPVPRSLGRALEPTYGWLMARRNRRFDAGVGVSRLPVPVISVGNLSVGGTGKTPMVVYLVRRLLADGWKPCIAMRGYARSFRLSGAAREAGGAASDEARMYGRVLPGVPVVAQPDRVAGVRELLGTGAEVTSVVLDDGFQHRRLARDLDIVLIDASRDPFTDRLLPAGWLREPVSSLKRAGAVVITHAEMVPPADVERIASGVRRLVASAPVAVACHRWSSLLVHERGEDREEPVEWLRGRRVVTVCAIGNPAGFLRGVWLSEARSAEDIVLPDHDPYRPRTIRRVVEAAARFGAEAVVTTEKDWAKLRDATDQFGSLVLARPQLTIQFTHGEAELLGTVAGVRSSERATYPSAR